MSPYSVCGILVDDGYHGPVPRWSALFASKIRVFLHLSKLVELLAEIMNMASRKFQNVFC